MYYLYHSFLQLLVLLFTPHIFHRYKSKHNDFSPLVQKVTVSYRKGHIYKFHYDIFLYCMSLSSMTNNILTMTSLMAFPNFQHSTFHCSSFHGNQINKISLPSIAQNSTVGH